ncbi:hypothetical protein DFP73DRAFT_479194 [Morchella snyderi]|nr:hypothetical protein DFP73DRAFT_479194 [Morchella snyderi]
MAQTGKVKLVNSGDSLLLQSPKTKAEKTFSLAYVSAPRLKRDGDEPYAFESRDFLRKLAVGKEVQFLKLYEVPATGREYGTVTLHDGRPLIELALEEGMVKLRDDGKREDQPENEATLEKLRLLEANARAEEKGMWGGSQDGRIDSRYEAPEDPVQFLVRYKGKPIDAIIERVISGDRVVARLLLEPKLHQQIVVLIAGIRAPLSKRTDVTGAEQAGEEFGDDAKEFVEARLLQRTVKVTLLGLSPQSQFIGNVIHPNGNIAVLVLSQGLATCVDYHSTMIGADMSKFRAAEKTAREKRLRRWKEHVMKAKTPNNNLDAVVSRVLSADTIFVRNKAGIERKINLSSVRQPKPSDPKQSLFTAEAKEFLRKKLIGKHVRIEIDGKRPATEGFEEREMATVTLNNKNIALLLVENGWASVIRHRNDDDDRSPIYDELLATEVAAQKEQKGMYAAKAPQSSKMVEASETPAKAKAYVTFLQRKKRTPGIVDFVSSGSRFKVIIPSENARLTFVLGGIRAPRTARNATETSEPFGQEALDYASRRCMQRDVEIDVDDVDRAGGFIGTMYVNRENVAKGLLEEGLASVHEYSAEKSGHATELFAAENRAKQARKGMWKDWTPEMDADVHEDDPSKEAAKDEAIEKKKDYRDVIVTNVDEQGKLKIQQVGTGTSALEQLMSAFRTYHLSPTNNKGLEGPPKVGEYVAAKFTEDNTFYRARVRHANREAKEADVLYIDYGNSEKIPFSRLRPLTQPQFQVSKLKAQAVDAVFSFLQFPTQTDYASESVEMINHLTAGRQLVANVDWTSPEGILHVTLYDPNSSDRMEASLNSEIVSEGLAMVPFKLRPYERAYPEMIKSLKEKETTAKAERRGMWEYGDITED